MSKVILFNPKSATHAFRIPNSILQIGASIHGKYEYVFVDGNLEKNPWKKIESYMDSSQFRYFGCTVMPGPQLDQAIRYSKKIKELFPNTTIIWGGYFPSNHSATVLKSGIVDFIINGPGDHAFPKLIAALENQEIENLSKIGNLIFRKDNEIIFSQKDPIPDLNQLPALPYDFLNQFYPIKKYLGKSFLGAKTLAYHSSFGCPFTCSFCAVVPIYNARWKGKSAQNIYKDIMYLKGTYGVDAIEFHDNNFFVSEKRVREFCQLIKPEKMTWWGEARIDTVDQYEDSTLALMKETGCKMIFFGAESSSDEVLARMDKGGKLTVSQMKKFAGRMKKFGIIPEYSFVLGTPAETAQKVAQQINNDIQFIKEIKEINPETEIIIYVYSPVPTEGSELYETIQKAGFSFPKNLEDWLSPQWANFDLRKNPLTPLADP